MGCLKNNNYDYNNIKLIKNRFFLIMILKY